MEKRKFLPSPCYGPCVEAGPSCFLDSLYVLSAIQLFQPLNPGLLPQAFEALYPIISTEVQLNRPLYLV